MAKVHGKTAYFNLDNSSGTPVDLSNYCDNVELPRDASLAEVTSFGDGGVKTVPGLEDSTVSISGAWDSTMDTHLAACFGHANTFTFIVGPAGSTAGLKKYTGECRIANYSVSSPVDGRVEFECELQVDGTVTSTTF